MRTKNLLFFMKETERLLKIIEKENLTPTQFADRTSIQRPKISHILNGRNAPSLDVMKKTAEAFPEINADWLFMGNGNMYRQTNVDPRQPTLFDEKPELPVQSIPSANNVVQQNVTQQPIVMENRVEKTVSKIVVFYSDNTFEEFLK